MKSINKKVLLRERKRHTARRVVSTPSVLAGGGYLTPPGGTGPRTPPGGVPGPPGGVRVPPRGSRYPPGGVRVPLGGSGLPPQGGVPDRVPPPSWHSGKCCKALWDMGTPPPVDRQMDGWKDRRVSKHYLPSYYVRGR